MCLEDVRIMGMSGAAARNVPIAAASTLIVAANQNRIGLIFSVVTGGAANIAMRGDVTAADGIALIGASNPFELDIFHHGDMCRRAWFGFGVGGATNMEVIELFLDVELARKSGYGAPPSTVPDLSLEQRSKVGLGTYGR